MKLNESLCYSDLKRQTEHLKEEKQFLLETLETLKKESASQLKTEKFYIVKLEKKLKKLEQKNSALSHKSSERASQDENIIDENVTLTYQWEFDKNQYHFELKSLEQELQKLKEENKYLTMELENAREIITQKLKEIDELTQAHELNSKEDLLQNIISEQVVNIQKLQNEIERLKEENEVRNEWENSVARNECQKITDKLSNDLQEQLDDQEKLNQIITQEKQLCIHKINELSQEIITQENNLKSKNEVIQKQQKIMNELQNEAGELENQLNSLQSAMISLEQQFNLDIEQGLQQKNLEIQNLKEQIFKQQDDYLNNSISLLKQSDIQNGEGCSLKEDLLLTNEAFDFNNNGSFCQSTRATSQNVFNLNCLFSPRMQDEFKFKNITNQSNKSLTTKKQLVKKDSKQFTVESLVKKLQTVENQWMEENTALKEELIRIISICAETKLQFAELTAQNEILNWANTQLMKQVDEDTLMPEGKKQQVSALKQKIKAFI